MNNLWVPENFNAWKASLKLKEVLQVQGSQFRYTFGDHVVRLLLGPLCDELDKLDEIPLSNDKTKKNNKYSCVLL